MTMRVPPNSLDLERAILCAALLESDTLDICERVKPETFYSEAHGILWREMHALRARGLAIDHLNLRAHLESIGKLRAIGGDEFLFALTNTIPLPDTEARARELCDLAQRRQVISAIHRAGAMGYDMTVSTADFLEHVQTEVFGAAIQHDTSKGLLHIDPMPTMRRIEGIARGEIEPMGLRTGLGCLDATTRGYRPGIVVVVAGRPGMGKSSAAVLGAYSVARQGYSAAVFSLEMSKEEWEWRHISSVSGIPYEAIETGRLQDRHFSMIARAMQEMQDLPLYVDDTPGITPAYVRAQCRALVARTGKPLGLIVIDHIGLMRSGMKTSSREQEISELARAHKEIAKEFRCTGLQLAQLNREVEKRADKRPQLSDLRDSGELEQSADIILFPFRRGYYAAEKKAGRAQDDPRVRSTIEAADDDGIVEWIKPKHRGGKTGSVFSLWDGECMRFKDYGADDYRPDTRVRGQEE